MVVDDRFMRGCPVQEWEEQQKKKQAKMLEGWDPDKEGSGVAAAADSDSDSEELPFACFRCRPVFAFSLLRDMWADPDHSLPPGGS